MFKSNEEFQNWCKRNELSEKAIRLIKTIRSEPPSRRVGGGAGNVCGFYNRSRKMAHSVQFESHTVELPFIYRFEFDEDVIEYWEQVPSFNLDYRDESGRRYRHVYTPDFFVIRKSRAGWVETKTKKSLIKLSEKFPDRYVKKDGKWISPAAIRYASEFGLDFEVASSDEVNYILQRNLQLLEPYYSGVQRQTNSSQERIMEILNHHGCISLSKLLQEEGVRIEDVYWLISDTTVFVDLEETFLGDTSRVTVYRNPETAAFHQKLKTQPANDGAILPIEAIRTGMTVNWDSRICKIILAGQSTALVQFTDEEPATISMKILKEQAYEGKIRALQQETPSSWALDQILLTTSESQRLEALRRFRIIEPVIRGESSGEFPVSRRTLRNWMRKYRFAEKQYGNGFYGLIPKPNRGNTVDRLSTIVNNKGIAFDMRKLMTDCIEQHYMNERQKRKSVVYSELVLLCKKSGVAPPSKKAFRRALKRFTKEEEERSRKGPKAAHQHEQFYYTLDETVPVHGDRPWQVAHLDHTELDIELVDSETRKAIGRPWLTILIDAYCRKIFAFHITFERPSYRSYLEVLRECVRLWNRLPETLVVDCGAEFGSRHFEMFLATYRINKKQRPPSKARFGSPIERFFGISNELFLHNLVGNTQIMKNVRQVSKSTNPKKLAAWTISKFGYAFEKWIEFYNNRQHGTLLISPNEAYELGMQKHPVPYRRIGYDQNFLIDSMPSPRTGKAKVDGCRGIKVNYLYYWSNKLALPTVAGARVDVRYDPFNLGVVYAFVNGQWEACHARSHYHELKNYTETELKYASAEIRKRYQNLGRRHVPNAAEFAQFFEEIQKTEQEEIEIRHRKSSELRKSRRPLNSEDVANRKEEFDIDLKSLKVLNWRKR